MNTQIKYLSGAIRAELAGDARFGYLVTPNMHNRPSGAPWGADTGCFTKAGVRSFSVDKYLGWLKTWSPRECLFATAPDVLGDAGATMTRSLPVLPAIRAAGFKAALVGQDGLEDLTVPWGEFDALFLGGSTEWKLSLAAAELASQARARGLWVHMGRVNSYRRLAYAASIGCDSADGTFLAYGPDKNLPRIQNWFDKLAACPKQYRIAA